MTRSDAPDREHRVLVLAPTRRDAELTQGILERALVASRCCSSLEEACEEISLGAAALLIPEEAVVPGDRRLADWLASQPPWSDLPLLVLARPGADSAAVAQAMDRLGNVTVLERPMRVTSLVSAVRTALRARQRQYQTREHLAERERDAAELLANDRRKDEFLAILAHELRNPLAPLRNSLHVLRLTSYGDPAVRQAGEIMERQVDHLVRLVDDLLEVSRITRGTIEIRRDRVDVASVVRGAVETSRPLIDAAGHRLAVSLPNPPLVVDGDPVRLAQILSNLLNNAAKYSDKGSDIRLTARREGEEIVFRVEDTGIGIAPEMLPCVFELFTQIDRRANRSQGGLGIGLTLVKTLVELHGGSVEARSAGLGRGSEFVVRLPLAGDSAATDACPAEAATPGALARRRVLVVDDNRDAADSLATVLRMSGAQVRVVHSGAEALHVLEAARPAIVLLDIGMPGMDGYEVARRIRERPGFADVRIVALTGWGQDEDRARSRAAGIDHHLVKPADIEALHALLVEGAARADRRAPTPT